MRRNDIAPACRSGRTRSVARRAIMVPGLIALALAFPPDSADAQVGFELAPFGGAVVFASDLSESFRYGEVFFDGQRINNAVTIGLLGGLRLGSLGLEASLAYIPATMVSETSFRINEVIVAAFTDQPVVLVSGSLLYFLPKPNPFIELFVKASGGIKRYGEADPFGGWDAGEIDPTVGLGGGLHLLVAPAISVRIDLQDYVSTFDPGGDLESQMQHDVLFTAGISYRKRP